MKQLVRKLALALLDDEQGITSDAFDALQELCYDTDNADITNVARATEGRFYIVAEVAKDLRMKG